MKTVSTIFLFIMILSFNSFAQDDSGWESRDYSVEDFSKIYLEGGFRVHLIQGNENKVQVKAKDRDVFDYLQVKHWASELRIDTEPDKIEFDRIALYITFKNLESLHIEGGVKLRTHGYVDLKDFDLYVAGGAKIDLELKAEEVKVAGEGGVLFDLSGIAKSLDVRLTGAGHVDAVELKTKKVDFRVEGVGTGTVYATESLYAKIEGAGKIRYKGNPHVTKNIEGLGSVKRY